MVDDAFRPATSSLGAAEIAVIWCLVVDPSDLEAGREADLKVLSSAPPVIAGPPNAGWRQSIAGLWTKPLVGLIAAELLVLWFFRQTVLSMLTVWSNSQPILTAL